MPTDRRPASRQDHVLHRRHRRDLLQLSVTLLCGGFGAARLLSGRPREADGGLTCVVNTADDLVYCGLHVSPDVDTVTYALAGRYDFDRGWGLVGDTFANAEALRRFGAGWFGIGDADLATHLRRTRLLAAGATLTEATAELVASWKIAAGVVPMSDDPVRTVVVTPEGRLGFQEYLVLHRARPPVLSVEYEGLEAARPAPGVLHALEQADLVIVAPSNPVSSITPILDLPGVREALAARSGPTVAVSPVVSGQAPSSPPERSRAHVRAAFMAGRGAGHTATDVARGYGGLADIFVLDHRDAGEGPAIEAQGLQVVLADTLAPASLWPEVAKRSAGR